jgi:hypothetical protein
MSGLKYVGGDWTEDHAVTDVVTKADLDNTSTGLIAEAPASQTAVQSAINTAVGNLASQQSVNSALNAFIQTNYLSSGNIYTVAVSPGSVGSYTLSYGTQTTAALAVGAPASALQAALGAFTNLTSVTVAGGTGGPYIVTLSTSVTSVLSATSSLTTGTVTVNQSPLIPSGWKGNYVAPLGSGGVIPSQYVPSLGQGYMLGPFGTTAIYGMQPGTYTGATPVRIADWNIGSQGMNFQPMAFMNLVASAINGGRPCVEILMSNGAPASYSAAGNTLIARGVGRNAWNDLQGIPVVPVPASPGHAGSVGTGYLPSYNIWLSAWIHDLNSQGVNVVTGSIFSGVAFLIRNQ